MLRTLLKPAKVWVILVVQRIEDRTNDSNDLGLNPTGINQSKMGLALRLVVDIKISKF